MALNIKVYVYENCNIYGRHNRRAIGVDWSDANNRKGILYILPRDEESIMMFNGQGHIRSKVKELFRLYLDTEKPAFDPAFKMLSELDCPREIIKDKVFK